MTEKKPNHLLKENSPYLLQHAYNPVDWHPWEDQALQLAVQQNKLLIISIGYAACHWCHVMEHESFEDEEVADLMNRNFISVKVDREERPDVDHVYMAAAYATSGRGGWPLNVVALPDQRPVFAGTYYSKRDWIYILKYFSDLMRSNPEELQELAHEIGSGMKKQRHIPFLDGSTAFGPGLLQDIYATWEHDLDQEHGGTLGAPKFPMPANLSCLLKLAGQLQMPGLRDYVELTLDRMAMGGIYDQLGGGFSRYSVDSRWQVPHFEKMLYDNAQLTTLYSRAYAVTQKYDYKKVVEETIAFTLRELSDGRGLFYASLDADSECAEGTFYTWRMEELRKYLGENADMFLDYYSCLDHGNWEHQVNVLRRSATDADFAGKYGITVDQLSAIVSTGNHLLFTVRSNRTRPATDDKILTCWNALMISALTEAARVFAKPAWLEQAVCAAEFYRGNLEQRNGKLWRNAKAGRFTINGYLDDYSFLIKAFLDLYQATFNRAWLDSAASLAAEVLENFTAGDGLFFCLASHSEPALVQETVELSDNVIPSSNSRMAGNLMILGTLLEREDYLLRAEKMVKAMIPQIRRNPAFHANWADLLADFVYGPVSVKISGEDPLACLNAFGRHSLPGVIFSPGTYADSNGKTQILVCRGKTCLMPVETVAEALRILQFNTPDE